MERETRRFFQIKFKDAREINAPARCDVAGQLLPTSVQQDEKKFSLVKFFPLARLSVSSRFSFSLFSYSYRRRVSFG